MKNKLIVEQVAPGWPGIQPRWTSSAKSGIGTSLNERSRVWFTLSHGIINEIYFPDVDQACTRDLGMIVTDGKRFFSEEKRQTQNTIQYLMPGVPAFRLVNTCNQGAYTIEKDILIPPRLNAVLQRTKFTTLKGVMKDFRLFALLAPHIKNHGLGNRAWSDQRGGIPILYAQRGDVTLAFVCSVPWLNTSVGFVGFSDGWQDLMQHKKMTWSYTKAENGNVALTGEIALPKSGEAFFVAVGFGNDPDEAGEQAIRASQVIFDQALSEYSDDWKKWQSTLFDLDKNKESKRKHFRTSAAVLRTSESKQSPGGIIASLSIPWGFAKGDDDMGGYHLVWPRDLVETAGALLAAGDAKGTRRVLDYLKSTQLPDGHWPQNMWLHGTPYWNGIQMDETGFPILLTDMAYSRNAMSTDDLRSFWPMVQKAASYLILNGPVTQQDRWEEDPGYSPFTLAVEIAALLAAADIADKNDEPSQAVFLRETADCWFSYIDRWTYVSGTKLAKQVGVDGYYVRIAPPDAGEAASPADGFVAIKNRPPGSSTEPAGQIISPDALALVRFGLRSANDPRIVNTVKVIDALLKTDTPVGPVWHRYDDDGYGEHDDGSPFNGTGVGRGWPLLTGERAHYELDAGREEEAERLLKTFEAFANDGGLISEQVWDVPDVPERELYFGRPSGSAMPLVWAHAEYIKLCRSLHDGKVFDKPPQPYERYVVQRRSSPHALWRFNHKCRSIPKDKDLRIEVRAAAMVHWTHTEWGTTSDVDTTDSGLGLYVADLPASSLRPGTTIRFTFYWKDAGHWEGSDFAVTVEG